jgi:hypothetical protein
LNSEPPQAIWSNRGGFVLNKKRKRNDHVPLSEARHFAALRAFAVNKNFVFFVSSW